MSENFKTVSGPEPRKAAIQRFIESKYGKVKRNGREQHGERTEAEEAKEAHGLTEDVPRGNIDPEPELKPATKRKATAKRSTKKRGKK